MLPIDKLVNLIKQHSIAALNTIMVTKLGIVTNYNPSQVNNYMADVAIVPDGGPFNSGTGSAAPTGLIAHDCPILTPWLGNGWGFYAPPSPNDLVLVLFLEGNFSSGFIVGNIFNNVDQSVQKTVNPGPQSGECWMMHQTGTFMKFSNDGTVNITCKATGGARTNLNINGNVVVTGNITATGNVLDTSGSNSHTVADMRSIFNSHKHSGVTTGAGQTQGPTTSQ